MTLVHHLAPHDARDPSDDSGVNAPAAPSPPAAAAPWPPSTRYSDQPTSLGSRIFGVAGVAAIALLIAAGALFTWTTYQASKPPAALSVFDVAPPAAPPEPANEVPPGPEQVQKKEVQPEIQAPKNEPPEIEVPSLNPLPAMTQKVPDPGPPVKDTTAPEHRPAPPAPQVSTGKPTWEGLVLGALNKAKRYPREASFRRQQGVPWIRFVMNRDGKVLSVRLEQSSGIRALDDEAVALPKRAQPFPKPPEDVAGSTVELVVPVEFFLR
jgi:protein TonB